VVATYLGVAQYLAGDNNEDTGGLLANSLLVDDEAIARLGRWYFANHLLRTGEIAAAEQVLSDLESQPQLFGRLAASLLAELQERR